MKAQLSLLASVAVLGLAFASAAQAHDFCSTESLKGTYIFSSIGEMKGKNYARAGIVSFDGKGGLHLEENDSNDKFEGTDLKSGKITIGPNPEDSYKVSGTYKVDGDCTGLVVYSDGEADSVFVAPNGEKFSWVSLDDSGDNEEDAGIAERVSHELIEDGK